MAQEASRPASRVDLVRALREAAITALIAFGMFLPLIGFNTVQNIHNELVLETRWPLLAALVGIITVGRFISCAPDCALARSAAPCGRGNRTPLVAAWRARFGRWLIPFALGFAVVYPAARALGRRLSGRGEMDRQFRRPDPDLRHAGLGPQHRGRARGPARSRLRRLLCRRRLFLCAARKDLRPVVLAVAAARGLPRGVLGHPARISGAAAARRLSGDRDARVRRDHPPRPDQLGAGDQRLCRHQQHPAPELFRHSVQRLR